MKETVLSCRHLTFFYDGDTPYENGAATSSAHSPAPGAATHENGSATAAQSSTAAPASHENGSAPTTQSSSSERPVFKDISLTLHRGEAILLMGPSGCGKSTLAYCLAGLYPEYGGRLEGEILVENEPIKALGPAKRATLVSILFQNPDNQFCMDRVDKEVLFALENINYQGDLRARMRELLKMVGLEASEMQLIRKLSGGMKQKLALCTALATGARTFILDEPFANLDPASCRYLAALLKKMKEEQGISLLVVDHKVDHWRDFMDRVVLMDAPEICGTNPHDAPAAAATTDIDHATAATTDIDYAAAATTTNTNRLYVDAAADTTNRAACTASTDRTTLHHDDEPCRVPAPGDLDARSIDPAQLEAHAEEFSRRGLFLGNGYVAGHEPRPISEKNDLAVVADDMEVLFDKKHSFMKHVNLRLEKGSVTALVGSCGSGKTSLLMALAEAYPHKGRLEVAGRVGLVFQNPRFQFLALTVEDELRQSLSLAHPDMPAEEMEALIDRQLEEFALPGMRKQSPYAISQGQQRRLALLSMLLCDCPIMLLDEPTYAQDERSTRFIMELLDKRIAEGLTVVMATHDPELAKAYANHIFVMQDGEMKEVSAAALDTLAIYASEETAPSDFRTATATDESGKNDTASTAESDRRETTAATAADDSERNDNDAAVVSENNKVIAGRDKTNRDKTNSDKTMPFAASIIDSESADNAHVDAAFAGMSLKSLNPGVKMLGVIIASLLLSVTFNIRLNLLVCAGCLLVTFLTPGVNRKKLLLTMLPFLIAAWGMFMAGLLMGRNGADAAAGIEVTIIGQRTLYAGNFRTGLQLASRIMAYGGLGILYAFTSEAFPFIMSLMQQFHLPPKFAYGILAAYHFFPVVLEEYHIVGAAMKVRGIKAGPLSMKRLIPMLVQAMERSSSLSMAMESRGFENDAPRARAFSVPFRARDVLFVVILNGAVIAGLFLL